MNVLLLMLLSTLLGIVCIGLAITHVVTSEARRRERQELLDAIVQLNASQADNLVVVRERDVIRGELHQLDQDIERYISDNAAYKRQIEILVNTNNELRVELALLKEAAKRATQPLDNATVQMPEVETVAPIPTPRAKRTARKDINTK